MDKKQGKRRLLTISVAEALDQRLDFIFSQFENVVVSISGGKDSTVLFHAAQAKAEALGRTINVFFLDQEAEYQSSIEIIRHSMALPGVRPFWFQVPIKMTNATSSEVDMLHAWEPGARWMRDKEPDSIHENALGTDRFYPFITAFEKSWPESTCFLVGLRSEESLNRYRAVTKNPGLPGVKWSTKTGKIIKLYPIYDFTFEDVWHYISLHNVPYNRIYDWLYVKNMPIPKIRVSNLIHEKSFRCLTLLQEFEPDTYNKLVERLPGVQTAALYGEEQSVYNAKKLPEAFKTWAEYRDHLITSMPDRQAADRFIKRFAGHLDDEHVHRQQVRQLLLKDWENSLPVTNKAKDMAARQKWMEIL